MLRIMQWAWWRCQGLCAPRLLVSRGLARHFMDPVVSSKSLKTLKRVKGIEPSSSAWKAFGKRANVHSDIRAAFRALNIKANFSLSERRARADRWRGQPPHGNNNKEETTKTSEREWEDATRSTCRIEELFALEMNERIARARSRCVIYRGRATG
jgi:hypothetical protein